MTNTAAAFPALEVGYEPDDRTADRILDGAMSQFVLVGIRRSSVADIARRAKVGPATVYRKFVTKDGVVRALVLREARVVLEAVDRAVGELDTLEERVIEGFLLALKATRTHPMLVRLLEVEPEMILPLLTVDGAPALAIGQAVLARHVASAGASASAASEAAEVLTRIGLSLVLTPTATLSLQSDAEIRAFARRYLVPIAAAGA